MDPHRFIKKELEKEKKEYKRYRMFMLGMKVRRLEARIARLEARLKSDETNTTLQRAIDGAYASKAALEAKIKEIEKE